MKVAGRRLATLLALVMLTGCAAKVANIRPGERPALDTDEAGLWMRMDRWEQELRTSGTLVRDPELNGYVRDVLCRVAPEYCADIRIYLVRSPEFNASMAPNGMLQLWTGTLLRTENEAQLAYVLGHEIGHYLKRHSLQIFRDVRSKTGFLAFFGAMVQAAAAPFGAGGLAAGTHALVSLATVGSLYAFSRDNEREADQAGFEAMLKAGYDPREAPKVWQRLLKEREAAKESSPVVFFATHPPTEERLATLAEPAGQVATRREDTTAGTERYQARILQFRAGLLQDELRRRRFAATQVLLDGLLAAGVRPGELLFFQGELYRLRAEKDDEARAIDAYRKALAHPDAPPEAHRNLGTLLARSGDQAGARAALERYLDARPDAGDREMIRAQIDRLP